MNEKISGIIAQFELPQGNVAAQPYGNGHINDTLCVTVETEAGVRRFILQRVNSYVFPRPVEVIENIEKVTAYLADIIREGGGDPLRETLTLVPTKGGKNYVIAEDGELWRMDRKTEAAEAGKEGCEP